jgi:hypothetical protein
LEKQVEADQLARKLIRDAIRLLKKTPKERTPS